MPIIQPTPQELAQQIYNLRIQIEQSELQIRALNARLQGLYGDADTNTLNQAMVLLTQMWAQHEA